jgi:hypothetical protein
MSSGRKARAGGLRRPPRGYYQGALGVLDAVRDSRIPLQAGYLWQVIQAYSFYDGFCAMTDVALGRELGGMQRQQVARLRAGLRAAGLLEEVVGPPGSNERRLIALWGQAPDPAARRASPGIDVPSNRRLLQLTSIEEEEEEELINALKPGLLKPPPPLPDRRARGAIEVRCKVRQSASTSLPATVNSTSEHSSDNEHCSASEQELAQYLITHGVFPRIAAELAPKFLARQDLADAKAEVLAWWFSVTEGEEIRSVEDGDDERLRGRLVTRLRAAAEGGINPPLRALGQALDVMRGLEEALSGEADDTWDESAGDILI